MQFFEILTQINSLPDTYTRMGTPFSWVQNSKSAALFRYANASDGLVKQITSFLLASGVWLDAWGKLFDIPRNNNEVDGAYMNRISTTLVSGRGTPVAIEIYVNVSLGIGAVVTENFTKCSWSLSLSTSLSTGAFQQLIENLVYVRPAGVPCLGVVSVQSGGLFLGSVNFLDSPRVTGAYLKTPIQSGSAAQISAYTNNSVPLLPTTFLTDPTLNPGLASG